MIKFTRPSRIIAAVLVLVSMLFMQLVLAGYVCPKSNADEPMSKTASMAITATEMPGCEQMDVAQPSLCHANAHTVQQSLDKHELPAVQPFIPSTISVVLANVIAPTALNFFDLNTARQSGAPPLPLAIRNCCFRI